MTDSPRQSDEPTVTARLKELIKDISTFAGSASESQQRTLLNLLEDWRVQGVLEDWRHGERRNAPRKPCSLAVRYGTPDRVFTDFIRNISTAGVFIETSAAFSRGEQITLIFSLPNQQEPIKITGEIVWTVPEGVGVKFTTVSKDLEAMIGSL